MIPVAVENNSSPIVAAVLVLLVSVRTRSVGTERRSMSFQVNLPKNLAGTSKFPGTRRWIRAITFHLRIV